MTSRCHLEYDFNSPPENDGLYRIIGGVCAERLEVGDEVTFGHEPDEVVARGVVLSSYRIWVIKRTSDFAVSRAALPAIDKARPPGAVRCSCDYWLEPPGSVGTAKFMPSPNCPVHGPVAKRIAAVDEIER